MKIKLHAKEDGLWLELRSDRSKRSAMINLGAKTDTSSGIIETVLTEVFNEVVKDKRRKKVTDLSNYDLTVSLYETARCFEHETRWIIEEAAERWGEDLDEEPDDEA